MQVQRDYTNVNLGASFGPALDVHQFNSTTMGDRALQEEVSSMFIAQLLAAEETLKLDLASQELKFLAHTLKGAALAIGACEIAKFVDGWDDFAFDRATIGPQLQRAQARYQAALEGFFHKT